MSNPIKPGDIVMYSRSFLNAIQVHTGWKPFAQGKVLSVDDYQIAIVDFGHAAEPHQIHTSNLVHADRLHLERT